MLYSILQNLINYFHNEPIRLDVYCETSGVVDCNYFDDYYGDRVCTRN